MANLASPFSPFLLKESQNLDINWPPRRGRSHIVPVFLPFRGCPVRCVFCAQARQTGHKEGQALAPLLAAARARLETLSARPGTTGLPELAFYGGTFTALPQGELDICLEFANGLVTCGLVGQWRCSTRPDCVSPEVLERLAGSGCATVELGVQSFATEALQEARRGYDGEQAANACKAVRQAGLRLGVQLLPGMPGTTPEIFLEDVSRALALGAQLLRFYPCLVLEGTGLAAMWREGTFAPWEFAPTLDALTRGWLVAHEARVPVVRMGLAPEPELANGILAGPVHPALGDMVLGRALLHLVREAARAAGFTNLPGLDVPRHCQGFFWGHRGALAEAWQELGLHRGNVRFVG